MRNSAAILPLNSNWSGKFQRFNATHGGIEMLKNNFQKLQLKWKIVIHFTRPKHQAATRKLFSFSPTHTNKFLLQINLTWNKTFLARYKKIYRYLLSKRFKNTVLESQEMVQCKYFSDNKQKHLCWKICKARKTFGCVAGAYVKVISGL